MSVTVHLPGALRAKAGGQAEVSVDVDPPTTLRTVLDVLGTRHPDVGRRVRDETGALRRYVNFYVDGEECRYLGGLDTPIAADSRIEVIPSVAGG
ncbi:MoaD/ThiS family protein [Actinokineospora enzanensis]|uniref:MoaD/ThiS family protein n=1 Tax=Actinokineospora enzanensis TaxID=155975 RepID=UPI00036D12D6|nr:MoaD/ThiS family protein [Actinokineospora enzanensis]